MRRFLPCLIAGALAAPAVLAAGDPETGKARALAVCAACHGANGLSVSDSIPHLAGQRAAYLEAQLRAWKDGSRQNAVMNAIATQLSAEEIPHLAAYFAALPAGSGKSAPFAALAKPPVPFPAKERAGFTRYLTIDMPATQQVRHVLANPVAVAAARAGRPLPDGSYILVEIYGAKLDAEKRPVVGADGHFVAEHLVGYTAMAREAGWGDAVPELLRNENWAYTLFNAAGQPRSGFNQAECLACHKPQDKASYLFSLDKLQAAVR